MNNLKDKLTNVCAVIMAIAGIVLTVKEAGVPVPEIVTSITTTAGVIAGAIIGYLTGKNPDGSSKQAPTNV